MTIKAHCMVPLNDQGRLLSFCRIHQASFTASHVLQLYINYVTPENKMMVPFFSFSFTHLKEGNFPEIETKNCQTMLLAVPRGHTTVVHL